MALLTALAPGCTVPAKVGVTVGAVLTWLNRGNHVGHAANSAFERVARLAERIGHEMENMTLDMSGQILHSAATRERLEGQRFELLGPRQVKGKREAVEVFSLLAA